jgi:hypothetical protein
MSLVRYKIDFINNFDRDLSKIKIISAKTKTGALPAKSPGPVVMLE